MEFSRRKGEYPFDFDQGRLRSQRKTAEVTKSEMGLRDLLFDLGARSLP